MSRLEKIGRMTLDSDAAGKLQAGYVVLELGQVVRTEELGLMRVNLDYDKYGNIMGVELIAEQGESDTLPTPA